jgi:hypothetical protein
MVSASSARPTHISLPPAALLLVMPVRPIQNLCPLLLHKTCACASGAIDRTARMSAWRARLARTVTTSNLHAFVSVSVGLAERLSGVRLVQPDHERVLHRPLRRGARGLRCGLDQPSSCQPCPAAASLFLQTTDFQRNKGVQSCVCDAHFYGVIGAACAACPSNQVRPDFINAATTLADCLCAPGFEPDPWAANLCRQCPLGTYKPYAGDHNCTACPHTLTTEKTGNANASACVCAPGVRIRKRRVQDMHGQLLQNRIQRAPVPDLPRKRLDSPRC